MVCNACVVSETMVDGMQCLCCFRDPHCGSSLSNGMRCPTGTVTGSVN